MISARFNGGMLLVASALFLLLGATATPAQFSLPKQSRAILSGQLIDADSGAPVPEATVIARTEYDDYKAKTDAAGNFLLEVNDAKGLKNFLIIFTHSDYRQKDISTAINATYPDKTEMSLHGEGNNSAATIKYRKDTLTLDCNKDGRLATKDGHLLNYQFECQTGAHTITFTLSRGNTIAISGSSDINIEINHDKTRIEYASDEPARIEIKALMFKR